MDDTLQTNNYRLITRNCVSLILDWPIYLCKHEKYMCSFYHFATLWWNRYLKFASTLQWRHNGRDGFSNHQPHDCLLSRLFRYRSKKTSKLRVTGLCKGNSPGTGEFPAQRASNAENSSIWWCHHAWMTRILLFCMINTMSDNILVTSGASRSTTILLPESTWNIPL